MKKFTIHSKNLCKGFLETPVTFKYFTGAEFVSKTQKLLFLFVVCSFLWLVLLRVLKKVTDCVLPVMQNSVSLVSLTCLPKVYIRNFGGFVLRAVHKRHLFQDSDVPSIGAVTKLSSCGLVSSVDVCFEYRVK